jgi:hypothetical protein
MQAESQSMLNTFTEHDFQNALKKRQKRFDQCIRSEEDYFEDDGGQ